MTNKKTYSFIALFGNRRSINIGAGALQPPTSGTRGDVKLGRNPFKISNVAWSPAEDDLLRTLHERYPGSWKLVADALNSSRIRTCVDLRTPLEIYSRWQERFAPQRFQSQQSVATPGTLTLFEEGSSTLPSSSTMLPPPTPTTPSMSATPQMTTRGVQRKATTAAQNATNLSINTAVNTVENRKRKRHIIINDSMRKTVTKRVRLKKQDDGRPRSITPCFFRLMTVEKQKRNQVF